MLPQRYAATLTIKWLNINVFLDLIPQIACPFVRSFISGMSEAENAGRKLRHEQDMCSAKLKKYATVSRAVRKLQIFHLQLYTNSVYKRENNLIYAVVIYRYRQFSPQAAESN